MSPGWTVIRVWYDIYNARRVSHYMVVSQVRDWSAPKMIFSPPYKQISFLSAKCYRVNHKVRTMWFNVCKVRTKYNVSCCLHWYMTNTLLAICPNQKVLQVLRCVVCIAVLKVLYRDAGVSLGLSADADTDRTVAAHCTYHVMQLGTCAYLRSWC